MSKPRCGDQTSIVFSFVTFFQRAHLPVKQFRYEKWPQKPSQDSIPSFFILLQSIQIWQKRSEDAPILVHCRFVIWASEFTAHVLQENGYIYYHMMDKLYYIFIAWLVRLPISWCVIFWLCFKEDLFLFIIVYSLLYSSLNNFILC